MAVATADNVRVRRAGSQTRRTTGKPPRWRKVLGLAWTALGWCPLTPLGLAVGVGLAALLKLVGQPRQDRVLMAMALGGLAIEGVCLLVVTVTAIWLRTRPQRQGSVGVEGEAGAPVFTGYSPGRSGWNPLIRVEVRWLDPMAATADFVRQRLTLVERAIPGSRGTADRVIRRHVVADVLHLCRVRFDRSQAAQITVLPAYGAMSRPEVLPQFVAGDQLGTPAGRPEGDCIEMRAYAPGDPLKLVLWKLYGRTGRLMVRTPERAVAPSEATLAYFVAGDRDEASAGVARGLYSHGVLGNAVTYGADGSSETTKSAATAIEQVVRSVHAREVGGTGLRAFLGAGEAKGVRACLLFVPNRNGAWLDRVAAAIAGRSGTVRVFVGVDGFDGAGARSRWARVISRREGVADCAGVPREIATVVERLESAGASVRVVDRISGRVVRPAELSASALVKK